MDIAALRAVANASGYYVTQLKRNGSFDPYSNSHLRFVHPDINNFVIDVWPQEGVITVFRIKRGKIMAAEIQNSVMHNQTVADVARVMQDLHDVPDIDLTFYS